MEGRGAGSSRSEDPICRSGPGASRAGSEAAGQDGRVVVIPMLHEGSEGMVAHPIGQAHWLVLVDWLAVAC